MTKTELIATIADKLGVSKRMASDMVNTFVDTVVDGVKKDGEVRIQGFGTFKVSERSARTGRNPRTGETIKIDAMKLPAFKAGAEFKKAVR
ncbi:HU family DNA-binding protein [Candidatus Absconditicoccus praedator]|uniref:HU family DNA-binding protein n=1 Tax=Candidatus Absconditicoccus praedator TaxID=2735562 RepID=UPI001E450485|nr:HU family DNA-binding protein [Candidatus Absconditicoccus praedator]UFX82824.1 HU family DNA-binding protein [Candidatus Absconditicoccus praedator]